MWRLRGPVWGWSRVMCEAVTGGFRVTVSVASVAALKAPSAQRVSGLPSKALKARSSGAFVIGLP